MNYYLATLTIYDGEHEHEDRFLVKANNFGVAWQIALKKQHGVESNEAKTNRNHGGGHTVSKLEGMQEINEIEANVLNRLGVAYFAN